MPIYTYEAANSMGKKVSASIEAADEEQVKVMLRGQGLVPLSIKASRTRRTFLSKRLTSKDLLLFTQELGNLLKSGLPVDRAIYVLSEHAEKDAMRTVLSEVYADLQRGQALSQALGHHKVFPQLYVNMIRAGELGGTLEEVIQRLAKFLETTVQFQTDITTAMYYPALLVFFGGASVAFIMAFVVPKFAEMFESSGQPLPTATAVLMNISGFFASYWWVMLAALIAAVVLLRSYVKTNEGKLFLDGLKLSTPIVKRVHLRLVIARFSRTLGTLLQSGVPVLEAIRLSRAVIGNEILSKKLASLETGVQKGLGIAAPLRESDVFPSIVSQIISVGEEAGLLEDAFMSVADRFESESASAIKRTVNLIGPVIILLMACLVGGIVVSMLLAVFSINDIPF